MNLTLLENDFKFFVEKLSELKGGKNIKNYIITIKKESQSNLILNDAESITV